MLEFEIAAIYYFVAGIITAQPYFEEVPLDMLTPCVFYPTPSSTAAELSTNAYKTEFAMYIKFMDHDTLAAYGLAERVLPAIMGKRRKIPLVDEAGKQTGKHFRVNMPKLKRIENGVYQMELSWDRHTRYDAREVALARDIFMNGLPIGKEGRHA
nr:hypothetical protein [uncultured Acetatifactor sp.]